MKVFGQRGLCVFLEHLVRILPTHLPGEVFVVFSGYILLVGGFRYTKRCGHWHFYF